ncbi:MAG: type II toxin-antitoxin system Phd/YefM family antitoxin [Bacillota bacterium]|nr:type II toxin-antitoxin system Phd/YefM family antitoxin [Bacillota bacterium]
MPNIRPISDLRNNANSISEFCHQTGEPVFITKNGTGDMVVMSIKAYERQQALIELYAKLAEAEEEIANGAEGKELSEVAKRLRNRVHGRV